MDMVSIAMQQTPNLRDVPFFLRDLEGPVRYDSSWIPGGRSKVLRQGLEAVELWTGRVSWHNPDLARSFSVVVLDQEYIEHFQGLRRIEPSFETFVVGVLQGDEQGVSHVYEWRTFPAPGDIVASGCSHWVMTLNGSAAKPLPLSAAAPGSHYTMSSVCFQHQM